MPEKKPRNNVPKLKTFGNVDVSVRVITFQMRIGHLQNSLKLFQIVGGNLLYSPSYASGAPTDPFVVGSSTFLIWILPSQSTPTPESPIMKPSPTFRISYSVLRERLLDSYRYGDTYRLANSPKVFAPNSSTWGLTHGSSVPTSSSSSSSPFSIEGGGVDVS